VIRRVAKIELLAKAVWLPKRVRRRCPAIMLADSRMARVPGRIVLLIVSMITMKGISAEGVPWGTKWANIELVKFTHPSKINESHRGSAREKVKIICLVPVKINGNNPIKLLERINMNSPKNIIVLPCRELIPNSVLISLCKVVLIDLITKRFRLGLGQ